MDNSKVEQSSKKLADLLAAKQPLFDRTIAGLEDLTQNKEIITKFEAEIDLKFQHLTEEVLKLKCDYHSGEEIYAALMKLMEMQNNLVLTKYLKLEKHADLDEVLNGCVEFAKSLNLTKTIFRLREFKAKEMLVKNPPREVMKLLGYDDMQELLKNEKLEEIYGALRFAEGDEWLDEFNAQYKDLEPEDFTRGEIEVIKMPLRWAPLTKKFIEKKKHNITHLKELGVILVLETEDENLRHGIVLKALPLIVHYFYEVHLYSAFFKLKSKNLKGCQFGRMLAETILASPQVNLDLNTDAEVESGDVDWRVVQRYFGKLNDLKKHPEVFEPHLQPEDLHWDKTETVLADRIPELKIWEESDYVAKIFDGLPVSLNFMDLTLSYANKDSYGEHLFYHFRESLWNEIFARYMGRENLEEQLLAKLDNAIVDPNKLEVDSED